MGLWVLIGSSKDANGSSRFACRVVVVGVGSGRSSVEVAVVG